MVSSATDTPVCAPLQDELAEVQGPRDVLLLVVVMSSRIRSPVGGREHMHRLGARPIISAVRIRLSLESGVSRVTSCNTASQHFDDVRDDRGVTGRYDPGHAAFRARDRVAPHPLHPNVSIGFQRQGAGRGTPGGRHPSPSRSCPGHTICRTDRARARAAVRITAPRTAAPSPRFSGARAAETIATQLLDRLDAEDVTALGGGVDVGPQASAHVLACRGQSQNKHVLQHPLPRGHFALEFPDDVGRALVPEFMFSACSRLRSSGSPASRSCRARSG